MIRTMTARGTDGDFRDDATYLDDDVDTGDD